MAKKGAVEDKDEDSRGGVVFYGKAEVHGDVAGRDKIVHSEEVGGDKVTGDKITGQVGQVGPGSQVAIGQDIGQTITYGPADLTASERLELEQMLAELKHQLAALELTGDKKALGQEFVGQLEQELTKTDEPPDASMIKVAGNWLLKNIPALAGTIAHLFLSPVVGKVVEAAGDLAVEWVTEQFSKAT